MWRAQQLTPRENMMTTTDDQKPKDTIEADSSAGVSCAAAAGYAPDVMALAQKWRRLKSEGDELWQKQERGNKGKARLKWWQASAVAEQLAALICDTHTDQDQP